jgi:hypothetical protein
LSKGRIPFDFRIAITGHRHFDDPAALVRAAGEAWRRLLDLLPEHAETEIALVAVSSLAEGADRLVARELLARPGSRLEVVLPVPAADYARDFGDEQSRKEFRQLLKRASRVREAPARATREEAYEWAGRHVVDGCDALIAVWDGEPSRGQGGTAEIVQYARKHAVPLAWVHVTSEPSVTIEDGERLQALKETIDDLNGYNKAAITDAAFEARMRWQRHELGPDPAPVAPDDAFEQAREHVAAWLVPFLVRADLLAMRLQHRFRLVSSAMFVMAAAAVAIVAIQTNFWPHREWIVVFEVVLLLLLVGIPLLRNKLRFHDRWTSYRFMAERLRSAYFLALAGTGDRGPQPGQPASFSDPSVAWIERALAQITAARPKVRLASSGVDALRSYLKDCWIGGQVTYHHDASSYNHTRETWLKYLTVALFTITLVSAVLHAFELGPPGATQTLIVLSISVPAIGAAVHGIETQREYRRHAARCRRMFTQLTQLQGQMNEAQTLPQIRQVAANVERSMREESNDWFGVMRFHDIELIM